LKEFNKIDEVDCEKAEGAIRVSEYPKLVRYAETGDARFAAQLLSLLEETGI
jgi:hypothetical protein